ncbi:phosphopantetheine-binding protein [Micromonospora sediminicola]|uniref:phosphopantetheine-binding protein n=1 Tax=Micromonospora sediminicola TaxID=946078 RepID=UPI000A7D2195|nr:phosphopantetheine-binding protein [Micromonospora sediminicola]
MSQTEASIGVGLPVDPVETLAALYTVPDVLGAVVTAHVGADGRATLLGYVTGPDPAVSTARIRRHLAGQLPDYLIPEHVFVLPELPLTPAGDYDLSVLPLPGEPSGQDNGHAEPRTPMERRLAEIMQELLGVDRVGVHDEFFALGGSSILATQLATRIREEFDAPVSLVDVLAAPTVDELAQLIVETRERAADQ